MNGGPLEGTQELLESILQRQALSSKFSRLQGDQVPGFGVKAGGYLTHGCATACLSEDILHLAAFMWFV